MPTKLKVKKPIEKKTKFTKDIETFHARFKLPPLKKPGFLDKDYQQFRQKFLQEELDEYNIAVVNGDLVKALDALVDLVYVALGTAYLQKLPFDQAWNAVQMANMTKKRVKSTDESKRGSSYDVVKPEGWTAPDVIIEKILKKYGA